MNENENIHVMLGRIDANVQTLLARSGAHDKRITAVERKQWVTSGGVAVAVALFMPKVKEFFLPFLGA